VTGEDPRSVIARAAVERGVSLAALSAALRRNPAYLQQYLTRGSPRVLAEADRRVLSAMLCVPESALGGPAARDQGFALPRLDVRASAGPGAEVGVESLLSLASVDPRLARTLRLKPGEAGVIAVQGDSMAPQLNDGDQLIVDLSDKTPGRTGRLYVVRVDGALMVKRVARGLRGLEVASDNPTASSIGTGDVEVVGRVVWRMGTPV
jgi:repressor LexA